MSDTTRGEWLHQPVDPDAHRDLGYTLDEWDRIETRTYEEEKYMYLPEDEDMLEKEAFIVVDPDDVCDLNCYR